MHINRTLQQLREDGLIEWKGSQVKILDFDRLAAEGEFDEKYLNLIREPR